MNETHESKNCSITGSIIGQILMKSRSQLLIMPLYKSAQSERLMKLIGFEPETVQFLIRLQAQQAQSSLS